MAHLSKSCEVVAKFETCLKPGSCMMLPMLNGLRRWAIIHVHINANHRTSNVQNGMSWDTWIGEVTHLEKYRTRKIYLLNRFLEWTLWKNPTGNSGYKYRLWLKLYSKHNRSHHHHHNHHHHHHPHHHVTINTTFCQRLRHAFDFNEDDAKSVMSSTPFKPSLRITFLEAWPGISELSNMGSRSLSTPKMRFTDVKKCWKFQVDSSESMKFQLWLSRFAKWQWGQ